MSKPWDDAMKRLVGVSPQDFVDWLVHDAQFKEMLATELPEKDRKKTIFADILLAVELYGILCLLHLEFQSKRDAEMAERLLEYNIRATHNDPQRRPVYSCVIYLRKDDDLVEPPLVRTFPNGQEMLRFHYRSIKLWETPLDELRKTGLVGLLPLWPLTDGGNQPDVVDEVIAGLEQAGQSEALPIAYTLASMVFINEDERDWLKRRFAMLHDIIRETWAYQEMTRESREEGLQEGLEKGLQEGELQGKREAVLDVVRECFPEIASLVKTHVDAITDPEVLRRLIVKMSTVQSADEARQYLLKEEKA